MELDSPVIDFRLLARSMGVRAERIENPAELAPMLAANVGSGQPAVIEVLVENRG
jgi:thiamine pyrophosphate-dependent acetolactate synthase large subunit-like protein